MGLGPHHGRSALAMRVSSTNAGAARVRRCLVVSHGGHLGAPDTSTAPPQRRAFPVVRYCKRGHPRVRVQFALRPTEMPDIHAVDLVP